MRAEPFTCEEILGFIHSRCEKGASITIDKRFRTIDGRNLWSIRGAGVSASGYLSLTEAFEKWVDAIEYDERKINAG